VKGGLNLNNLELVKKAINGNDQAFETLIKNESEKLYKTAFLYLRNKEDALDVLQETIYKAFVSIEQVKQPEFFYTWLMKILIRTAYDLLKKRKKILILDDTVMNNLTSNETSKGIEDKLDIVTAISKLNENYQTVIILFFYHDLTIQQIAATIGKPENTIKTYLRRAKLELKKNIEGGNNSVQRAIT
jgi:RNA polymerase sigma-70 factor, ECF subfamily